MNKSEQGDGAGSGCLEVYGGGEEVGGGVLGFVERAEKSSMMLKEQAGCYSDAFDLLACEMEGITKALGSVMDSFSGPSIASQLMLQEEGGSAAHAHAARRSLRGQRKPGSQLLWPRNGSGEEASVPPGVEVDHESVPVMLSGASTSFGDAADKDEEAGDLGGTLAANTSYHGEIIGSSILVDYSHVHCDALGSQTAREEEEVMVVEEEEERKGRDVKGGDSGRGSRPESGAASRAVTRPQTTMEKIFGGVASGAAKEEGEGKEEGEEEEGKEGEEEEGKVRRLEGECACCDVTPKSLESGAGDLGQGAEEWCLSDGVGHGVVHDGNGDNGSDFDDAAMNPRELEVYQASKVRRPESRKSI